MSAIHDLLKKTDHRPWPMPERPWIMEQVWRDLLFAHWRIPVPVLRQLVPPSLELDTFEGEAWITVAPFRMSIRFRGLPVLPGMSAVPELNCRTYVSVGGKPGVYFFSLDITSAAAAWAARRFYHLPYYRAQMQAKKIGARISYTSNRNGASWQSQYEPTSAIRRSAPGTLEHWLTERYCLYAVSDRAVYRGEVHHEPWPLQDASVKITDMNVLKRVQPEITGNPEVVSFTPELRVLIWLPERL